MKDIFYALLIISLIVSCKSNTKQAIDDSTNKIKPVVDQTQGLITKFKPIIQGVWVKKDYIDKVSKTKSPLAADDEANDITTMVINTDSIKDNMLIVPVGAGNHEGSEIKLKIQAGKAVSTLMFGDGDLGYSVENGDTLLVYSRPDERQKKIITTKFIRALKTQPKDDLGYGMYHLINKALISGNYKLTDTAGSTTNVSFTDYGKVIGFPGAETYFIDIDFTTPPGNNTDQIDFNIGQKNNPTYAFKFNHDTLNLYQVSFDKDSIDYILGKRVYKLVKQK